MKYDKDGVVCGLNSTEHVRSFLSGEEAERYFDKLKGRVTWAELSWSGHNSVPRLIYQYYDLERQTRRHDILEELILQIEEVFETPVSRIECSWYRDGNDFRPCHQDYKGKHIFILTLGCTRKTVIKEQNSPEGKVFNMNNGDVLYVSAKANTKYEHCCLRDSRIHESQIELVFFSDTPYINRKQHLRDIHVLGVGKIPVWFHGPAQEWTKDLTAAILPASFHQLLGGAFSHPVEDAFNPIEISFEIT